MDPHTSTLESDVSAVHAKIEAIHSNYATTNALLAAEGRLDIKIESAKNELNLKIVVSTNELDRKIDNSVNELSRQIDDSKSEQKYELNRRIDELDRKMDRLHNEQRQDLNKYSVEVRNWFLGTVIGLFVAFGSMTFAMFNIIKP